MIQPPDRNALSDSDYEAIAGAVEETVRGRWFLAEYAQRMRQADTRLVLDAVARLEHALAEKAGGADLERMRAELVDMVEAIARTKTEIAAIRPEGSDPSQIVQATDELDAIVALTERATSDILNSAEQIQEIAWTLRERGTDANTCDRIDALTTETYIACSFQDITGQRTRKVIDALHFLERRLEAMIAIWREPGAAPSAPAPSAKKSPQAAPAPAKPGLEQRDVFGTSQRQTPLPAPKSRPASADIDSLTPSEKMALFS
jgi:chemotaxis regulatin CheY-phosphate phosphatase CheZ